MGKRRKRNEGGDEDNGFAAWGGYMNAKKAKLVGQYTEDADRIKMRLSNIFDGVAIMVNGWTKPSADELKELMVLHGGTFHLYQMAGFSGTTHIIASNLPNVKIKNLGNTPIVKPEWIVESIKRGRLLDYKKFLLYTNHSRTQPRLEFPVLRPKEPNIKESIRESLSKEGTSKNHVNKIKEEGENRNETWGRNKGISIERLSEDALDEKPNRTRVKEENKTNESSATSRQEEFIRFGETIVLDETNKQLNRHKQIETNKQIKRNEQIKTNKQIETNKHIKIQTNNRIKTNKHIETNKTNLINVSNNTNSTVQAENEDLFYNIKLDKESIEEYIRCSYSSPSRDDIQEELGCFDNEKVGNYQQDDIDRKLFSIDSFEDKCGASSFKDKQEINGLKDNGETNRFKDKRKTNGIKDINSFKYEQEINSFKGKQDISSLKDKEKINSLKDKRESNSFKEVKKLEENQQIETFLFHNNSNDLFEDSLDGFDSQIFGELQVSDRNRLEVEDTDMLGMKDNNRLGIKGNDRLEVKSNDRVENENKDRFVIKEDDGLGIKDNVRLEIKGNDRLDIKDNDVLRIKGDDRLENKDNDRLGIKNNDRVEIENNDRSEIQDNNRLKIKDTERVGIKNNENLGIKDNDRLGIEDNNRLGIEDNNRLEIKGSNSWEIKAYGTTGSIEYKQTEISSNKQQKVEEYNRKLGNTMDENQSIIGNELTVKSIANKNINKPVIHPKASTKTASDPTFLSEFYNNSRLHLISTLGAEFKQLVCTMREKSNRTFPGRRRLPRCSEKRTNSHPVIMHIDMDCFFVSVGTRNRPDLLGKPVAVAHARGNPNHQNVDRSAEFALYAQRLPEGAKSRLFDIDSSMSMSEIASCSYEARKYGIKNGMFLGAALKLCPELKMIPYDFQGYKDVSKMLYETIASYTLDIEAVSCDEMYVDVTKILEESGLSVEEWSTYIRGEIIKITGCPCSAGFGSNRLQARLATRKAKPNGQYYLETGDVEDYMCDVPLKDLPGVGNVTVHKLGSLGLRTCGDVQRASLQNIQVLLGQKAGLSLFEQAKGIDKRPLNFEHERKSVSAEVNYGIRFKNNEEALNFLENLSKEVASRLKEVGMKAKSVTLKLMVRAAEAPTETAKYLGHGICDSLSRTSTTSHPIEDYYSIFKEARSLYEKLNIPANDLRGVGIQLGRLTKLDVTEGGLKKFFKPKDKEAKFLETNEYRISKGKTTRATITEAKQIGEENNMKGEVKIKLGEAEMDIKAKIKLGEAELKGGETKKKGVEASLQRSIDKMGRNDTKIKGGDTSTKNSKTVLEKGESDFQNSEANFEKDEANFQISESNFEIGEANFETGEANFQIGESNFGIGEANFEIGEANFEISEANFEMGKSNFEIGEANYEIGESNFEIGESNFEIGKANLQKNEAKIKGFKADNKDYTNINIYQDNISIYEDNTNENQPEIETYKKSTEASKANINVIETYTNKDQANININESKVTVEKVKSNTILNTSRKRGRPKGSLSKKHQARSSKSPSNKNSLNKSSTTKKNVSSVKGFTKSCKFASLSGFIKTGKLNEEEYEGRASNINLDVLKELPVHIREEVMQDLKRQDRLLNEFQKNVRTVEVAKEYESIKKQPGVDPAPIKSRPTTPKKLTFRDFDKNQFREMIRCWLRTELPLECDVTMLADHFKELVMDRKIEYVQIMAKFLHRLILPKDCLWHQAYFEIINCIQEGMLVQYEGTLMVPKSFKCEQHS